MVSEECLAALSISIYQNSSVDQMLYVCSNPSHQLYKKVDKPQLALTIWIEVKESTSLFQSFFNVLLKASIEIRFAPFRVMVFPNLNVNTYQLHATIPNNNINQLSKTIARQP
jgi:hypothetical protein